MDYYNDLPIIFKSLALINVVIIMFVILLSSIGITLALLQKVTQGSTDLYQYKVKNFYLSYLYASTYILGFIFFLYGLRFYNVHHSIDLKELYQDSYLIYNLFKDISIVVRIYIVLLCLIVLCIFMVLISIHKFFIHHIFILYIYLSKNNQYRDILVRIGHNDIISHYIYQLSWNLTKFTNGFDKSYNVSRYHFHHLFSQGYHPRYKLFVVLSPLIFVLYDCIFNSFILIHVFYYLLFYIPLMILKRVTTCVASEQSAIRDLLWDIL
jgi:hypothetical protein